MWDVNHADDDSVLCYDGYKQKIHCYWQQSIDQFIHKYSGSLQLGNYYNYYNKGNNLSLKKMQPCVLRRQKKLFFLTTFFNIKISGCKSLSPASPQSSTQYIKYGYAN